ncbi:MAG: bifunctional riboflavin kinase/FAD synthetase [Cytophagales bacterium]|nr:bifunctional riboflavin kinase/FAD synthetase [Bernardetiaceae bacterium]MDW8205744.1 bifunctional riboflavin kinase/FAD synthetase [Cytophagales bacterium]
MKVQHGITQYAPPSYAIVTEGTFDGVHIGHRKILSSLVTAAQQAKQIDPCAESVVITFWPHPRLVLFPEQQDLKLLSTFAEKTEALATIGIDRLVVLPFDKTFSNLTPEEYVQQILIAGLNTRQLIIGYDHRFGKNRTGDFNFLKNNEKRFGFTVEEIPRQDVEQVGVSSTKIRHALLQGEIATANRYLAAPYSLSGKVVRGNQLGRALGFPTANLYISETYKLIPKDGIYAVRVHLHQKVYNGMLYIGVRSTIGNQLERSIEVNIFDFEGDLYDKFLKIELIAYLRGEEKFDSLETMKQQLYRDRENALRALHKTTIS